MCHQHVPNAPIDASPTHRCSALEECVRRLPGASPPFDKKLLALVLHPVREKLLHLLVRLAGALRLGRRAADGEALISGRAPNLQSAIGPISATRPSDGEVVSGHTGPGHGVRAERGRLVARAVDERHRHARREEVRGGLGRVLAARAVAVAERRPATPRARAVREQLLAREQLLLQVRRGAAVRARLGGEQLAAGVGARRGVRVPAAVGRRRGAAAGRAAVVAVAARRRAAVARAAAVAPAPAPPARRRGRRVRVAPLVGARGQRVRVVVVHGGREAVVEIVAVLPRPRSGVPPPPRVPPAVPSRLARVGLGVHEVVAGRFVRARPLAVGGDGGAEVKVDVGLGRKGFGGAELEGVESGGIAAGDVSKSKDGFGGDFGRVEDEVGGAIYASVSAEQQLGGSELTIDPLNMGLDVGEMLQ